jgi:hypothetical protein
VISDPSDCFIVIGFGVAGTAYNFGIESIIVERKIINIDRVFINKII